MHMGAVILIVVSHIVVFLTGVYIARDSSHLKFFQTYKKNDSIFINSRKETSLFNLGMKYQTDKVTYHHYEKMYEKYLQNYIGTNVSILEIGLGCGMAYGPGASAYVWRNYFGPSADIHYIEYDQNCAESWYKIHGKKLNIIMHYGSQEDVAFLKTVDTKQGYFDIIVDDGGHTMKQQITSITHLLSKVRSGGIYVIEDLHTSYFSSYGGGYLLQASTIEFIKRLIDDIHTDSPTRKAAVLATRIFSFEISNKICFFNII